MVCVANSTTLFSGKNLADGLQVMRMEEKGDAYICNNNNENFTC